MPYDHPLFTIERLKADASALLREIEDNEAHGGGLLSRHALVLASRLRQALHAACSADLIAVPVGDWTRVVNAVVPPPEWIETEGTTA